MSWEYTLTTAEAKIIHVSIDVPWRTVYDFAHRPENMPRWAAGLASGFTQDGDEWIADGGPLGNVRVRFVPPNIFGVIDHEVMMPNGTVFNNALRVVPNGDGAEVMFTVLRLPEMDDAAFETDAGAVHEDLRTLKTLVEELERENGY